jgi:hypothetical protein
MPVDETVAVVGLVVGNADGIFALTNSASGLTYKSDDEHYFQGNYDYQAHAQVYAGGADPLGSQGYVSVEKNPSSS